MENTKVKIELDSKDALSSIKDLNKALKATKDEMVGLEPGSEGFKKAANRAGELKHQLDEINWSVRGASRDFGDMIGNLTKVGAGISGAFQAAQGAMNLFGVESENVTEAIQKMQSVMALTQGLASIDQGIKSFWKLRVAIGNTETGLGKFKKALIGTGLGALVVVLGSIIANWEDFTKEIGLSTDQMNKLGEVFGGVTNVILKSSGKIAQAFAKIVKGDFSGAWDELKQGWDFQAMYAEGVQKSITEREQKETQKRLDAHANYVKQMEAEYDRQASKVNATIDNEIERTQELIRIEQERLKLYKEGSKEYYDILQNINKLNESLKPKEEKQKTSDTKEDPEITKIRNRVQALKDSYRDELQVVNDAENEKLASIQTALDRELITRQEYENLYTQIKQEAEEKRTAIADEQERQRLAKLEEEKQAQVDMVHNISDVAAASSNLLTNVLSDIADAQDTSTKEGFEKQKKLQIAAATIQMLTGIATAFTGAYTTKSGPWDFALMGIQAATIAASGIANIAKIKSQRFDSASSSAPTASISQPAAALSMPVQYTQDVQGAETIGAIKDQKVYVTETDITATQKKVDIAETESVF